MNQVTRLNACSARPGTSLPLAAILVVQTKDLSFAVVEVIISVSGKTLGSSNATNGRSRKHLMYFMSSGWNLCFTDPFVGRIDPEVQEVFLVNLVIIIVVFVGIIVDRLLRLPCREKPTNPQHILNLVVGHASRSSAMRLEILHPIQHSADELRTEFWQGTTL